MNPPSDWVAIVPDALKCHYLWGLGRCDDTGIVVPLPIPPFFDTKEETIGKTKLFSLHFLPN